LRDIRFQKVSGATPPAFLKPAQKCLKFVRLKIGAFKLKFDKQVSLTLFRSLRADWILAIARAEIDGDAKHAEYYENMLLHTDRMIEWLEGQAT
jgi:hypothetical protein